MPTPIEVVQHQLEAYNARDLARYLALFSETIRLYRPPAPEPVLSGKEAFGAFYAAERFNKPGLRADIVSRTAFGNKVIDHERIFGVRDAPFEIAVVYEVADGLIQTMWSFAAE